MFISRKLKRLSNNNYNNEKYNVIHYRDYKNFEKSLFDEKILNFNNDINSENIDKNVSVFNKKCKELFEQFFPLKSKRVKNLLQIQYLNKDILNLITKRNKIKTSLNRKKRNNFFDYLLLEEYKRIKNIVNLTLKQLKKDYYQKKVNEFHNNSRKLWKLISETTETKISNKKIKINFDMNINEINDKLLQIPE